MMETLPALQADAWACMQVIRQSMQDLLQAIQGDATAAGANPSGSPPAVSVMQLELRQSPTGALELHPSLSEVKVE